jgi:primosomal protein N'
MRKRKSFNSFSPAKVIENAQLKAIESIIMNPFEYFERKVRRWFSKEHATPYLDTFQIPWEELLLHYYESNLAAQGYNEVFDLMVKEFLPEFKEETDKSAELFAKSLEKDQQKALKANKKKAKDIEASKVKTQPEPSTASKIDREEQSIRQKREQHLKPKPKTMSLKFEDDGEDPA